MACYKSSLRQDVLILVHQPKFQTPCNPDLLADSWRAPRSCIWNADHGSPAIVGSILEETLSLCGVAARPTSALEFVSSICNVFSHPHDFFVTCSSFVKSLTLEMQSTSIWGHLCVSPRVVGKF